MVRVIAAALCALFAGIAHGFAIEGVVLGTDGRPVTGAGVWLNQQRVVHVTESDAQGRFEFPEVYVGDMEVVAYKDGLALGGITGHAIGPTAITVYLGEPAGIPLRIIDQTYKPVEGARLIYLAIDGRFHVAVDDLVRHGFPAIRSDEHGRMHIPAVPKRSHVRFAVSDIRYAQTFVPYFTAGRDEQDIVLKDGIVLRGRVVNPAGEGVSQARVAIFVNTVSGLLEVAEPMTDPEGFYNARVHPGPVSLAVRHPAYAPGDVQSGHVPVDAESITIDVQLEPPHYVSGTVIDRRGDPVPAVEVAYIRDEAIYEKTITDLNGAYRMNVSRGEGSLYVFAPQGYLVDGTARIPMTIESGQEIVVQPARLLPLPVIEGEVINVRGEQEAGMLIVSTNLQTPVLARTGGDARFRIAFNQMPYEERLHFVAEHPLRFQRRTFSVDPRDPSDRTIKLMAYEPDTTEVRDGYAWNDLSHLAGKPAPPLVCDEWWNGGPLPIEDIEGRVVVLTFWGGFATIGPGRDRIEELNWLHEAYQEAGDVIFIGVHDNSLEPEDVEAYINQYNIQYPVGRDRAPAVTFTHYGVTIIPQTVLLDRAGNVRYYDVDGRLPELIKLLRRH